jgi:hypothetical protein
MLGRPAFTPTGGECRRSSIGQLRLAEFDLDAARIDRDQRLDLATFAVSEAQIEAINAAVIDCRGNWPPPKSGRMQKPRFAGFREIIRGHLIAAHLLVALQIAQILSRKMAAWARCFGPRKSRYPNLNATARRLKFLTVRMTTISTRPPTPHWLSKSAGRASPCSPNEPRARCRAGEIVAARSCFCYDSRAPRALAGKKG